MGNRSSMRINLTGLNNLARALGSGGPRVQIGIFGSRSGRKSSKITNADIGRIHEFGIGVPQRSFLRMPISYRAAQIVGQVQKGAAKLLAQGGIMPLLKRLGVAATNAVDEAFETGGFGTWAPLKYSTIIAKLRTVRGLGDIFRRRQLAGEQLHEGAAHAAILIQTGQLRNAVTWRIKK